MKTTRATKSLMWLSALGIVALAGITLRILAAGGSSLVGSKNNLRQPYANTNGLVAWYPFDGDAKDYSGNTYDGTNNTATFAQGKFGKSLKFNGTSDAFNTSANVPFSFTNSSFSVSLWVNTTQTTGTGVLAALNGTFGGWSMNVNANQIYANIKSSSGVAVLTVYGSKVINDGSWHHVVIEFTTDTATTGNNTITIYLDGTVNINTVSATGSNTYAPVTAPLWLGARSPGNSYFSGSLDDLRIYNRILSASEITQLFAGSPSQNCDQTCITWLKFDDNSGTSAKDSSGHNTGTVTGTAIWTTGNFASALTLDGSTGYVSVPNLGLSSGTVDMWINPTSVAGDQRLFTQLSGSATQAGQLALNQSSGENGSLWVFDGTTWQRLSNDASITSGTWNQIVVTNSGGTATAFINGTQQLTAAAAFNFGSGTAGIGAKFLGTTGGTFNGTLDDFRVYSRILAPEEVADQYRTGT